MASLGVPVDTDPIDYYVSRGSSGIEEVERRIQEALYLWMKSYFTGDPVSLVDPVDGMRVRTFEEADFLWGQDRFPDSNQKPVIHSVIGSFNEERCREDRQFVRYMGSAVWNMFVRVTAGDPQSRDEECERSPDQLCRLVAGQLAFLVRSRERGRLFESGITNMQVVRGPELVNSGPQFLRQLVIRHSYSYRIESPLV